MGEHHDGQRFLAQRRAVLGRPPLRLRAIPGVAVEKKRPTGRENSVKIHGNKKTEYRVKKLKVGTFDADDQFQETNKQTNKQNRRQRRRQENEAESSIRKNFLELVWRLSFFFFL